MAIQANSIPVPARPLLAEAPPSGGLLPSRRAELLAILEQAPTARSWGFMTRPQRQAIQDGVDALIAYLDAVDPDPDLEDDGCAEPCLGARCVGSIKQLSLAAGARDDREGDFSDDEPSLGATCFGSLWQDLWSRRTMSDLEEQGEDEGAGACDREPDLGSLERIDQRSWAENAPYKDEPTLGSRESHHDQRRWSQGRGSRELHHDERAELRSWGQSEARRLVEKARHNTEAALRSLRPIRADMGELRIVAPGIAAFCGVQL